MNRYVLKHTLCHCRQVTLDIDATLITSSHKVAKWTYKGCQGHMPIVGHIAETGQVVASDFREGNVSPSYDNLGFIHQCEAALPDGVTLSGVRIDAAGYQGIIIDECIDRGLTFAIRAVMSRSLKQMIMSRPDADWQALLDRDGQVVEGESTTRLLHTMENNKHTFSVVVQRRLIKGQQTLNLNGEDALQIGQYQYRAITISDNNRKTDSEWVHWYNQRGEHSENRIKELKQDFSADRMPCADRKANALYFSLCTLAYNLFVLLRMHLPAQYESMRAKNIRWRLYALAGKVIKHGRKLYLKLQQAHQCLLCDVLMSLKPLAQAP